MYLNCNCYSVHRCASCVHENLYSYLPGVQYTVPNFYTEPVKRDIKTEYCGHPVPHELIYTPVAF